MPLRKQFHEIEVGHRTSTLCQEELAQPLWVLLLPLLCCYQSLVFWARALWVPCLFTRGAEHHVAGWALHRHRRSRLIWSNAAHRLAVCCRTPCSLRVQMDFWKKRNRHKTTYMALFSFWWHVEVCKTLFWTCTRKLKPSESVSVEVWGYFSSSCKCRTEFFNSCRIGCITIMAIDYTGLFVAFIGRQKRWR